jgi:phosphodiesterase/alkaline phosphatase D-like protein
MSFTIQFRTLRWTNVFLACASPAIFLALGIAQSGPPSLSGELRVMAGPIAQNVSDHSATVFWLASRNARMTLSYGRTEAHLDQIASADELAGSGGNREHRVKLKNLDPNQTYFFQILDEHGAVRAKGQFQTEPTGYAQDGRLKILDGPVFEYLDSASVEIAWTTNAQSSTLVRYGANPNDLRKTVEAPWGQETHRVTITGLEPNATYYFVVESGQASDSGTMAKSNEGSFRTEYQGETALTNIEPRR